ncbi:SDR family oxidoreductase [Bradyrhizobium embrapense]|uniref:SDR family oxidoreductase n=1 Tax=Bradyrhizobium embrapense TaxID=630921 RepID=UPI00067C1437|nr:SDR family oxidoreductase [Bradyrhizobium embrapense]
MGVAVITGTSSGIGLATAATLARSGHLVFAGMRNLDRGDELRAIVSREELPVKLIRLDVDSDASVNEAFRQISTEVGEVDILVNNAGVPGTGPVELAPMEVFRQSMETNFFGAVRCIKAVVPSMRQRRTGCIVNVTSVAGQFGMAALGPYTSTKWALEGLSESLAQELRPFDVRVAMIEPGVVATPMTTKPKPSIPVDHPYYSSIRRLLAYFDASLEDPTSPLEVAETILRVVDSRTGKLRNPSGRDGAKMLLWRTTKTDEAWVDLAVASDADWSADVKRATGVVAKLPLS